jgi:hypothetical protein
VAAVLAPIARDALPVRSAVAVTGPVPCLLAVVVGALLGGHVEQRGPSAEAVEPGFPASAARHPGLKFGPGEARALLSLLVSHAAGVPFGLLGACASALQGPRVVPHVRVVRHATVIPEVASRPRSFGGSCRVSDLRFTGFDAHPGECASVPISRPRATRMPK